MNTVMLLTLKHAAQQTTYLNLSISFDNLTILQRHYYFYDFSNPRLGNPALK